MELLGAMFSFIFTFVIVLFTTLSYVVVKTYTGKSVTEPDYPPVKGTAAGQIFHIARIYDRLTEFAREKKTFRLLSAGPSVIYTTDPLNVQHFLKTRFDNYSKGEYNREILEDFLGQGIFAADGEKWKQQRKLASLEFSTRVLRDYSCSVFRKNAAKLARKVKGFTELGRDFDVQDLLMRCTLDTMFEVGFGVQFRWLEGSNAEEAEFMRAFDEANISVSKRYMNPFWKLSRCLNLGSEATLKMSIKTINKFVYDLIDTKRKQVAAQRDSCEKEDILSRFLVESEKEPETFNDKYLKDIILSFMVAGKDTSASTLSWFLYMLCKHPSVQEKIAEEVKSITGSHDDGIDSDEFVASINEESLDRMHYLHAALTETLRLYPVVPVDGRCAERDDILPDGYKVKKGDQVNYLAYAMGRLPHLWGDDAESYRPERWLKDGIFQPESPFKFVSFHVRTVASFPPAKILHPEADLFLTCSSWCPCRPKNLFGEGLCVSADEDIRNVSTSFLSFQIDG